MKSVQTIFLIVLFFISCKNISKPQLSMYYRELDETFIASIAYLGWDSIEVPIFHLFANNDAADILNITYNSFDGAIGYNIIDSIIDVISRRPDLQLSNHFQNIKDFDLHFIASNQNINDYLLFSEPIKISNNLGFFSISRIKIKPKMTDHWVFYYEKVPDQDYFRLIAVYDWQKDMLFKAEIINKSL